MVTTHWPGTFVLHFHLLHPCILHFAFPSSSGRTSRCRAPVTVESAMARNDSMTRLARLPRRPSPDATHHGHSPPQQARQPWSQPRRVCSVGPSTTIHFLGQTVGEVAHKVLFRSHADRPLLDRRQPPVSWGIRPARRPGTLCSTDVVAGHVSPTLACLLAQDLSPSKRRLIIS